jgi:hypothetical protein
MAAVLRAGVLGALLATLGCAQAQAADLQPAAATLCTADELVVFSCVLGPELVSLCATRQAGVISALSYREGRPGRVTRSHLASAGNGQRFQGTVSALAPRALVRQVWFERDGLKVLLSECVGGDCPQQAAQVVWRGDQLLSVRRCQRSAADRAWFSRELVKFGADAASSRVASPLLQLDDIDNGIEAAYPMGGKSPQ